MQTDTLHTSTSSGTLGGTLLVLLLQINWQSLAQTAIIAAVGASSSFLISMAWQWIFRHYAAKKKGR